MTRSITILVPGEPRGKARARVTKAGHAYTPRETVVAEQHVRHAFVQEVGSGFVPLEGPLSLTVSAAYCVPQSWSKKKRENARLKTSKPDLDNIIKLVKDALNKVAWLDDSQIAELIGQKFYAPAPSLAIIIRKMEILT